ncbi:aminotransferase class I/II-fold pyridoxal phosphate-dependent enzyme [Actinoplanes sp. NPDC049596]|uniref:MalY/PatB family protein n=1 Tax=unclassified Actinoplanes TaxID=2626549 RepID=UPI00342A97E4
MSDELVVAPLAELRRRRSEKWRAFPDDVLPLFVAEMDYDLAPPVTAAISEAVRNGDLGYASSAPGLGRALAGFAARQWGWEIDPGQVTAVTDVGIGVVEMMRALARPGDAVVINPPVYSPFFDWVPEVGARILEVPLADGRLDLPALAAAFATHPAAFLLCNPHNPVGRAHTRDELAELVRLAHLYRVPVISDEIHAPLVLPGATFTPFLTLPGAPDIGVSVLSASKAFNIAGLKCATVITTSPHMAQAVSRFPRNPDDRVGHLGVLASIAAFTDGDPWLATLRTTLANRRSQLADLLQTHLPTLTWTPPEATYLAWLDASPLGRDADPQSHFLTQARVALEPGPKYGAIGSDHVRLNFATSPEILTEAVSRMAASLL